uniref:Uncharacterized protein n=1 Tax=viral metagenome TaxID=1070528 RepID=A0A6M3XV09_9ZZZZ
MNENLKSRSLIKHKIINMCGREVAIRKIEDSDVCFEGLYLRKCADCDYPTKFVVIELFIQDVRQPRIWGYCGICEVG